MKFFILMIKHKGKCKCNTAFANPNIKFTALDCPIHGNPAPDKLFTERTLEKEIHDIMADFMVDLCEQKRHDKHICQPNNKLWIKNHKRFEDFIKSALKHQREEIISEVCMEIACFSPISAKDTMKLLEIIRKL